MSVFNVCKNSPAVLWVTSCWSKHFWIVGKSVWNCFEPITGHGIMASLPWWSFVMKFVSCSSCTIFWNFSENLQIVLEVCNIYCDYLTLEQYPFCQHPQHPRIVCISMKLLISSLGVTLMIIISIDWNREGFAAGSSTVDEDWNDWNNPAISRDKAKLFLKRIWNIYG